MVNIIILFLGLVSFGCVGQEKNVWVFTQSSQDKPIAGCLSVNQSGLSAIIVSMNCQKSFVDHVLLCSQKRTLSIFNEKKDCVYNRENSSVFGHYELSSDPYER